MAKRNVWSERKMGPKKEYVGLDIDNSLQKRRHGQREGGRSKDVVS